MVKPSIAILTTFYEFSSAYSLCSVVESQLIALVKHGYRTILFVHDNFVGESNVPKGVEIRKVIPRFKLIDYSGHQNVTEDFNEQVETAYQTLKEHTKDIDIIIEHDLIFQGWFLPYCVAIHKLADETNIKWFHWVHSVPNLMPNGLEYPHTLRYRLPRNSKLVYLNNHQIIRAAESYGAYPKDVRIIYNSVDPRLFQQLDTFVIQLINEYDLLSADFLQVYPVSTPRMVEGKGLKHLINIFGALKKNGKRVRLIVCNAHANADKEKELIEEMYDFAITKGLNKLDLIFTSLKDKEYELGVPRHIVSQLFQLSNLFIFPTTSENCSLILLEAMLSKNILVLNDSVPQLREFGGEDALYFKFGGLDEKTDISNPDNYYNDIAKIIISEMSVNKALKGSNKIKQQFNYDYIFKNQIEPLFYEKWT